jgi:glycosyltransferase involved in cell wall biosynthesis
VADLTPTVTVVTPTYNRAAFLPRVHDSLVAQTFRDFEWIVIDDGSNDGTGEVVADLASESDFAVRYEWQPNSGKHVAVNKAVEVARGRFYAEIESDDWMLPTGLETFMRVWDSIPVGEWTAFSGVTGLCVDPSGEVIGDKFPPGVGDTSYLDLLRLGIRGDKSGCGRIEPMREIPFPVIEGERMVIEAIVYRRMARHYLIRCFNEPITVKDYQPTGLSATARAVYLKNPKTVTLSLAEMLADGEAALRVYANHFRFALHARAARTAFRESPSKLRWAATAPVGAALYVRDRLFRG